MQCQNHNDREAVAMCISCRNFFCVECKTAIDGRNYCFPCSEKIAASAASNPAPSDPPSPASEPVPVSPPSVTPPPPIPPVTPVAGAQPPVKKKSGCLKWAIIIMVLFLLIASVLAAALYIGWKHFAPKLQPQETEQQFAESTTAESGNLESGEQPAPVAEDTSMETQSTAETEPAPEANTESEPEPEPDPATSDGSSAVSPPPLLENKPNPALPGMKNPMLPVPTVDPEKLLSFLPKASNMWRSGTTNSGTYQKNNITYTSVQREYYFPPQNCKVTITIYDYGRNLQMYRKFMRPEVYTNANGYQKLISIKGQRGIEKMDSKIRTGELSIEVARRYVVEVQGENIPNSSSLEVFAQDINIPQLAQLQ